MLVKFCQQRATTVLSPRDVDLFQTWLLDLLAARMPLPLTERDYDWHAIAHACDVDHTDLQRAGRVLAPGLDALRRELARRGHVTVKRVAARRAPSGSEREKLQRDAERRSMRRPGSPRRWPISSDSGLAGLGSCCADSRRSAAGPRSGRSDTHRNMSAAGDPRPTGSLPITAPKSADFQWKHAMPRRRLAPLRSAAAGPATDRFLTSRRSMAHRRFLAAPAFPP